MLPAQYCEIMAMTLVFGNAAVRQVTDIPRVGRLELEDAAVDAFKQLSLAVDAESHLAFGTLHLSTSTGLVRTAFSLQWLFLP